MLEVSPWLPAWRRAVKLGTYEAYRLRGISPQTLPVFPAGVPVTILSCVFYVTPEQCRAADTDDPVGVPDIDKLLRSTLDALGGAKAHGARLFADDAQITIIRDLRKERATTQQPAGAEISVWDGRD